MTYGLGAFAAPDQAYYAPADAFGNRHTHTKSSWMSANIFGERFLMGNLELM